jgi:hypothetical protein
MVSEIRGVDWSIWITKRTYGFRSVAVVILPLEQTGRPMDAAEY